MTKQPKSTTFQGHSFCFSGELADLKRTQAEREVRARGGMTTGSVTARLDYLIVGSIPSPGWRHGNYGTKVVKARGLSKGSNGKPQIISEQQFVTALAETPANNSGAIDAKIVVCTYHFSLEPKELFDRDAIENILSRYQSIQGCFASARASSSKLFAGPSTPGIKVSAKELTFVDCRIVKQFPLDEPVADFVESIQLAFENLEGIDGRFNWFERTEGSGDYVRLLKEIPISSRIEGL